MILQRFLEGVLSALSWLVDMLFPRVALLTILLCLGLGALFLLVIWRSRTRGGSSPGQLPLKVAAAPRKQDRPPS